jgi:hypothetical protein
MVKLMKTHNLVLTLLIGGIALGFFMNNAPAPQPKPKHPWQTLYNCHTDMECETAWRLLELQCRNRVDSPEYMETKPTDTQKEFAYNLCLFSWNNIAGDGR